MNGKTHLIVLALLAFPLLQACDTSAAWEGTITDSAGVTIVSNTNTPLWSKDDTWTVEEDLRIGTVTGEPEYQFGNVAFLDVAEDGTIYVMDMMAQEARAFDTEGNYLTTIGGPGGGPGELGQGAVFVLSDPTTGGVVVPDMGNTRVNRYSPEGEPLGSFPIQIQAGAPARWEIDDAGRLMAQLRGLDVPGMAALSEGDPIVVYDTTGVVVDTVAVIPKGQMVEEISEQGARIRIFAPEPVWGLDADGSIYYAMSDRFNVFVNTPDGALTRIIRKDVPVKSVEEADREALLSLMREQYEQFGIPPAQIEQIMSGVGFAENYPAFGNLLVQPDGTLWAQRVRSARDMGVGEEEGVEFDPQDIGSPEWEVFDAEGRYLGVVILPERVRPVQIVGDNIYAIGTDELDVQYVLRLKINRPVAP